MALVLADLRSVYGLEIINGATTAAMGTGTSIAVSRRQREDEGTDLAPLSPSWFTQMRSRGCIGCVVATVELSAAQVAAARHEGIPIVVIDPLGPVHEGTVSIGATNWNGGVQATEHLVNLGHERIAVINGVPTSVPAQERLRGILTAMRAHGITLGKRLVHTGAYVYETGFAGAVRWFSLPPGQRPTAVLAGSDVCAMGVYEAARRAGLRVPEDVSVVGFDDSAIASWASPRLTTVRQPLARMGAEAVRTIVEHRSGRPLVTAVPMRIETTLIERDSTAPPAAA
ncbi:MULTISPECIES: substrate-binding domain-containing protein [unclassified Actinomyces]|uniref:substrate-binding domain-containing protein n=1 Tax=unclassified Actinomyces TaxID=2609248 RepID=UPI0028929BFF|nr:MULTISPECIES: substrate-binding domain-containing protein [unclassified Actinomyces]